MTWYKTDSPYIPVNVLVLIARVNTYGVRQVDIAKWDEEHWRMNGYKMINKPYAWAYFPTPPDPEKIS